MSVRSSSILMNALNKAEQEKKAASDAQEDTDATSKEQTPATSDDDVLEFELLDDIEDETPAPAKPPVETPPPESTEEPPLEFVADETPEAAQKPAVPLQTKAEPEPGATPEAPSLTETDDDTVPQGPRLNVLPDQDDELPPLNPRAGQLLRDSQMEHKKGPSGAFLWSMAAIIGCGLGYWGYVFLEWSDEKGAVEVAETKTAEELKQGGTLQERLAAIKKKQVPAEPAAVLETPPPADTTATAETVTQSPVAESTDAPKEMLTLAKPVAETTAPAAAQTKVEMLPVPAPPVAASKPEALQDSRESGLAALDQALGTTTAPAEQTPKAPPPQPKPQPQEALHPTAKTGDMQIQPSRQSVDEPLNQAYSAWRDGDDINAGKNYERVLAIDPHNRDALLGLAAVSLRQGKPQRAYQFYQRVRRQYPNDPVAQAGIVNMLGQHADTDDILALSDSLARNPHDAYLHFALGNVYARQGRWGEAQQAYFEAYRRDATQPDHVYNLAVSLEHLGQARAALPFYQQAAELAEQRPVSFDVTVLKQRIAILRQNSQ